MKQLFKIKAQTESSAATREVTRYVAADTMVEAINLFHGAYNEKGTDVLILESNMVTNALIQK